MKCSICEALLAAAERAFNLIKESGFKPGLTEEEFDGTLFDLEQAIIAANGDAPGGII